MVIKTILIFLIALLGYSEWLTGTSYLQRPIVLGPLVGLVMGDMVTGTIMGATMELAMVGAISVGAYNPPDTISGTILGVSLAMQAGADASAALTLGIPIATIVLALDTALGQPVMLLLVHRIDKNVEDGDTKAITRNMLIAGYAQSWCGLLIIPWHSSLAPMLLPACSTSSPISFRPVWMSPPPSCPHSVLQCWLR